MSHISLGPLTGGKFEQYTNVAGQVYYYDTVIKAKSLEIPNGFEDAPNDNWIRDTTKSWPQWIPDSDEHIYRWPLGDILRFVFPTSERYSVVQETVSANTKPDLCLFKLYQRNGGSLYQYEYMLVECKKPQAGWSATEDQLHNHLEDNGNETKNCYGMVQIGFDVQFYKYERRNFSRLSGKMHLINDANEVTAWLRHIKDNPMWFV